MDEINPIDILARTIWGEARGDGALGMNAVAHVVMNRVSHGGWWGCDVISVCLKAWQFSCWNVNDPNREKLTSVDDSDPQFAQALDIAANAIDGTNDDPTDGSDSYITRDLFLNPPARADGKPNWWQNLTPTAEIVNQVFYKTV
jgi:spore germination cell wall hydrolase CwlJ-like protein